MSLSPQSFFGMRLMKRFLFVGTSVCATVFAVCVFGQTVAAQEESSSPSLFAVAGLTGVEFESYAGWDSKYAAEGRDDLPESGVYVFGAAVNAGLEWLVVVGVINSVISAYYYFGVIKVMYLSSPQSDEPILSRFPIRLAVGVTTIGVLVFGVYPIVLLDIAKAAAQALFS